jgi:monofunctional chorismate mutase
MNLEESRQQIDAIDKELFNLFEKRLKLAVDVAAYKKAHQMTIFRPEREQAILDHHAAAAKPGYENYVRTFFHTCMECGKCDQLICIDAPIPSLSEIDPQKPVEIELSFLPDDSLQTKLLYLLLIHEIHLISLKTHASSDQNLVKYRIVCKALVPNANFKEFLRAINYYSQSCSFRQLSESN